MNTQLRVWWIPQVPGHPFHVPVSSVQEGVRIMDVLANYDRFQFDNRIKPDYCNAGGLEMWDLNCDGEGTAGWCSWYDEETGTDDPAEFLREQQNG